MIDYERDDVTKNGKTYDVILDAVGKHSFGRCKGSPRPRGVYLPTDGFRNVLLWLVHKRFGDSRSFRASASIPQEHVVLLAELLRTSRYRPVIDRVYPLEQDVV